MAAVALRWPWFRLRPARSRSAAAAAHLDRLVRREARAWPAAHTLPPVEVTNSPDVRGPDIHGASRARPRISAGGDLPTPADAMAELAEDAWERARHIRRRRRLVVLVAAALLGCVGLIGPRPPHLPSRPEPLPPGPTAVPAGVRVLPAFARLADLEVRTTALPRALVLDRTAIAALSQRPLSRAVAVLRQDVGPLVVVAVDGTLRSVNDPPLAEALLFATSLSPDGERIALASSGGLLVVDVTSGTLRSIATGAARPGSAPVVWRTPRTVLVPVIGGSVQVNVDSGAVTALAGLSGQDVTATEGPASGQLVELISTAASIRLPARIRLWRTPPASGTTPPASGTTPPASGTEPAPAQTRDQHVEDRPIFGPPWIGTWIGPGWSTGDTFVRACEPRTVRLPPTIGTARGALGAVSANGLYAGTLVTVDDTPLEILGFVDMRTVLVGAWSSQVASMILAWNPHTGALARVTTIDSYVRISVADLLVV
jgi:hypothetical protein